MRKLSKKDKKVRLSVFISPQRLKEMEHEADKLGINKNILGRLVINHYLDSKKKNK